MKYNVIRISLLCSVALTTLIAGCAKYPQNLSTASNLSLNGPALVAESIAPSASSGSKVTAPVKSRLDAHLEAIYGHAAAPVAPTGSAHITNQNSATLATRNHNLAPVALENSSKHSSKSSRSEVALVQRHSHKHVSPKVAKLDKKIAALSHKSPHSKKLIALKKQRAKLILAEKKKNKHHHKGFTSEAVASAKVPSLADIAGKQNELDKTQLKIDKSEAKFEEREAKIAKADAKREPIAQSKLVDPNGFAGVDDGMPIPKEDEADRPLAIKDAPPAPVADNDILPKGPTAVPPAVEYPDNGEPIRPTNRYNQATNQATNAKSHKAKGSSNVAANVEFDAPDGNDSAPIVIPQEKTSKRSSKPQVEISQLNPKKELNQPEFVKDSSKSKSVAINFATQPSFKSISGKDLAKNKIPEKAVPVMAGHWTGDEEGGSNDSIRVSNDLQHIVADRVMEFDGNRCRVKTEGHFILADAQIGLINGDSSGDIREIRGTLISSPFTLASSSENADTCGQIIRAINESNVKVLTQGESVVVENEGDPILLIQGRRYTRSPAGGSKL